MLTEIEAMGGAERSVLALSRWPLHHGLPHHFATYVDERTHGQPAASPLDI